MAGEGTTGVPENRLEARQTQHDMSGMVSGPCRPKGPHTLGPGLHRSQADLKRDLPKLSGGSVRAQPER